METFFTNVYNKCEWGNDFNTDYAGSSGGGSDIDYNKLSYIPFLKNFIQKYNIKTIIDLGCGNFKCGSLIYDDLDIIYTGYDVYKNVIDYNLTQYSSKYNFIHLDIYNSKENIINGDLCIIKDILQHWTSNEIYTFLDYLVINQNFKYILIINCCNQKIDDPVNEERSTPLSINFYPLKKYNPIHLFNYKSKEVSVIC
jgi:hypothetical protein